MLQKYNLTLLLNLLWINMDKYGFSDSQYCLYEVKIL